MANTKITELTAASGVTVDDLLAIVNDPAGTPATQKATVQQLMDLLGGTFTESATLAAPGIISPPNNYGFTALNTWYAAGRLFGSRVTIPVTASYRYMLFRVGVQSGNIRCAVAALDVAASSYDAPVMDSGDIACPASGNARVDLGATELAAGEYLLLFGCDNTTASFAAGNLSSVAQFYRAQYEKAATINAAGDTGLISATGRGIALALEAA